MGRQKRSSCPINAITDENTEEVEELIYSQEEEQEAYILHQNYLKEKLQSWLVQSKEWFPRSLNWLLFTYFLFIQCWRKKFQI